MIKILILDFCQYIFSDVTSNPTDTKLCSFLGHDYFIQSHKFAKNLFNWVVNLGINFSSNSVDDVVLLGN